MIIKKDDILKLQRELNWKGKGSKGDPLIIDSLSSFQDSIWFSKCDIYIIIKDVSISRIDLRKPRNIKIKNCKVLDLWIYKSQDLFIEKNKIYYLSIENVQNSTFKLNKFHEIFAESAFDETEIQYINKVLRRGSLFMMIFLFSFVFLYASPLFNVNFYIVMLLLISIIFVILFIYFVIRRIQLKNTKKILPNLIRNNISTDLVEDFRQFFNNAD